MRLSYLFLFLFVSLTGIAQYNHQHRHHHNPQGVPYMQAKSANSLQYSEIKILLSPEKNIHQLAKLGLDVTHGTWKQYRYFISEFSALEIAQIEASGFEYEVQIEDMHAYYEFQNELPAIEERGEDCNNEVVGPIYQTPENFQLGSMGGFFTYEEMIENFNQMAAQHPDLISPLQEVPNIQTHNGRPIYWFRVSDNPNEDETDEPEVLYTALHHAREPMSLTQMIFYVWYLLENYDNDTEIQFLIENTEMYFMPCLNPDSYVQNQLDRPAGGGMIRKNQRVNEDGTIGVDLNRNYGFEWGYDNSGSSPFGGSATYRGTAPFSEPETQAVRNFCNAHEFVIALNYHSFGNLLIYPWGYLDQPTEDAAIFNALADAMTVENDYLAGTGSETVGYIVNGVSDDWMYGETESKPKIFAMTPEVGRGSDRFWPRSSRIEELCKDAILTNFVTANAAHPYPILTEASSDALVDLDNVFEFDLENGGLEDGIFHIELVPISDNIASVGDAQIFDLASLDATNGQIEYQLSDAIVNEEEVLFFLRIDNGRFTREELIRKIYYAATPVFTDKLESLDAWVGEWQLTDEKFVSAPTSMTDSPNDGYAFNMTSVMELKEAISLEDAMNVRLRFHAQWDLGEGDYVTVSANLGETGYFPLCSENTDAFVRGAYLGQQLTWVAEDIDLTEFLVLVDDEAPLDLRLKFELVADGFEEGDGFYFDDIEVVLVKDEMVDVIPVEALDFDYKAIPNPTRERLNIQLENPQPNASLRIYNAIGQILYEDEVNETNVQIDIADWSKGVYFYQLEVDGVLLEAKRVLVQ